MYSFEWDKRKNGYVLTTQTGKFVANEIRPVFAEELLLIGLNGRLEFDPQERSPLLWAKQNVYLYRGQEILKINKTGFQESFGIEWKVVTCNNSADRIAFKSKLSLVPVDIRWLIKKNKNIMSALVSDTLKRIKEMYDSFVKKCDAVYIGFSGGKDSVVLLDLCHKVLPLDIPVVFSDTDMELPDTYQVWEKIQSRYNGRPFLKVSARSTALENWETFGPPSQALRWCCSVHKSAPAILALKEKIGKKSIKTLAFVGVRGEESQRRSEYNDIGDGLKSHSQVNVMPLLSWSAHEVWLYIFEHDLVINEAYRKGLPRVGCLMCPMSSNRQNDLIRINYPEEIEPFTKAVRYAIDREFASEEDANAFVYQGGWYARKSGVSLRDIITEPSVERKSDQVLCEFPIDSVSALKEWIKTIGTINNALLSINEDHKKGVLHCVWREGNADKSIVKFIVYAVHKAIACIGCNVCVSECPTGALGFKKNQFNNTINVVIDEKLCTHCMKCYAPREGCWRYYSKRYAGAKTMNISGINKYMTFGLKPEWIEVLATEGSNFRQTTALGNRMVPAAVTWFRESGLIEETTSISPTLLLDVGKKRSFSDLLFWQLLWFRLANISPLVKWYVCNTEFNISYFLKQIDESLAKSVGSASVRKGALQSLCQLVKSSSLSYESNAPILAEMKGRVVEKLTRRSVSVDPLVTLYGLYVIAEMSNRGSFTVRQMIAADFDSEFVSPIMVFGASPDEFKKHCMGLAVVYPDFIRCSFTLGLDEVQVFPEMKSRNDVVALILEKH